MPNGNKPKESTWWVYFLQGKKTNLIKVGITRDLKQRIKQIRFMSPDKLKLIQSIKYVNAVRGNEITAKDAEYRLHRIWKKYRKHGEWFTTEILLSLNDIYFMVLFGGKLAKKIG
jgi:predicted GIY-YIG superfamily endonuclease